MAKTLLSIGHGYVAQALEPLLLSRGWHIIGTTRSREKASEMAARGVEPVIWPDAPLPIGLATHLLCSVSPDDAGDPVLLREGPRIAAAAPGWIGYLSATSVYGDAGGDWVDETTPPEPGTDRGRQRLEAEDAWLRIGGGLHIFRIAGIYGPGRSPFDRLRAGDARRIRAPDQAFSRIHVEDIARILAAAMEQPVPGIYNLADELPAPSADVIAEAARILGVDPPPEQDLREAGLSQMARSFYSESKRVRGEKARAVFGAPLLYPSYREGLRAIHDAEKRGP